MSHDLLIVLVLIFVFIIVLFISLIFYDIFGFGELIERINKRGCKYSNDVDDLNYLSYYNESHDEKVITELLDYNMLNELSKKSYETALANGFYKNGLTTASDVHLALFCELAESSETLRFNRPAYYEVDGKPEGESVELADVMILIMSYFSYMGWDLGKVVSSKMAYNVTRKYGERNEIGFKDKSSK